MSLLLSVPRVFSLPHHLSSLNENGSLQRLGMALMSVSAVEWCVVSGPLGCVDVCMLHIGTRIGENVASHNTHNHKPLPCVLL